MAALEQLQYYVYKNVNTYFQTLDRIRLPIVQILNCHTLHESETNLSKRGIVLETPAHRTINCLFRFGAQLFLITQPRIQEITQYSRLVGNFSSTFSLHPLRNQL